MNVGPVFGFTQPLWWLLVPACCVAFVWLRRGNRNRTSAFAEPGLLAWLLVGRGEGLSWRVLVAWLLVIAGVSGPYLAAPDESAARRGIDIAIVLDISPSMAARDVSPDRLQRARLELHDFLSGRTGDRVALVAFSGYAYTVLPLTHDLPLVRGYIDALDTSLTRHQGSNLVQALEHAAQTLEPAAGSSRAIVLLTDGEVEDGPAVLAAADRLAARGIPVHVLGIGSPAGGPVPTPAGGFLRDASGTLVISRPDRDLLRSVAARSGGAYADVRPDDLDWAWLASGLARLERQARPAPGGSPHTPLYAWLLAPALALLLWPGPLRLRPATPVAVAALAMLLAAAPLSWAAGPWTERSAWSALIEGRYAEAERVYGGIEGYRARLGEGAAAYRQGEWTRALALYLRAAELADDDIGQAVALYNAANALARMNRLEDAIGMLDNALALHPNHARAALNRDLLSRALSERPRGSPPPEDIPPRLAADRETMAGGGEVDGHPGGTDVNEADRANRKAGDSPDDVRDPSGKTPRATAAGRAPVEVPIAGAAGAAAFPPGALNDDPREVLRHRFAVMDATRVRLPPTRTW